MDEYHYEKPDTGEKVLKADKRDVLDDIRSHVEKSEKIRKLDEYNPHEQAQKFRMVKENPPDTDFMKVELFNGADRDNHPGIYSRHVTLDDGREVWVEHDPFFVVSGT